MQFRKENSPNFNQEKHRSTGGEVAQTTNFRREPRITSMNSSKSIVK